MTPCGQRDEKYGKEVRGQREGEEDSLCRTEIACKYDEPNIQVQGERGGKVERKKEGNGGRGGGTDMIKFRVL